MRSQVFIRVIIFLSLFFIFSIMELFIPDRSEVHTRRQRWPGNLMLFVTGIFFTRFFSSVLPVAVASFMQQKGWGLTAISFIPSIWKIVITILALDLWVYFQHVLSHIVPGIRDIHRVHHTDTVIDVTNALRFHPVEIIFSVFFKSLLIFALGLDPLGVFIFEVLLNGSAMFHHSNIKLSPRLDKIIRIVIVTPAYHRVHHSRKKIESNSNYGFFLTIWDRIFLTYTKTYNEEKLRIGVPGYNQSKIHRIDCLLIDPFYSRYSTDPSSDTTSLSK